MIYNGNNNEYLEIETLNKDSASVFCKKYKNSLNIIRFLDSNSTIKIDGKTYQFETNSILFLTENHIAEVIQLSSAQLIRFNREFYCISTHDSEVGCKGILFYGMEQLPKIVIPPSEIQKIDLIWEMLLLEIQSPEELQLEMLQSSVKKILILSTRYYKDQNRPLIKETKHHDVVREFQYLVETHHQKLHLVAEYAKLLYRTPKSLSNLFSQLGLSTPLQIIHQRIMMSARREIINTSSTIKEISYNLGFEDVQSFSRFFKKHQGVSPSEYKKQQ